MAKRTQRSTPIAPRIEPISGSTAAPPAPGNRDITESPGQNDDGRRSDQSAHHAGVASSSVVGGAPTKRQYPRAKY
jgi:hypothetical protein